MIDPVTRRYADALFNLAKSKGALDEVSRDVQTLGNEFSSPKVAAFLADEQIPMEERRGKMAGMLSGMNELTRNFVNLVLTKNRNGVLPGLASAFRQRWLTEMGAVEGVVQSARALGQAELASLQDNIGKRLSKKVTLENEILPALVGGLRVLVDGRLIDYSVQGRLDGLRKRLLEAKLPSA